MVNKNWQNKIKYYDKLLYNNNPYNILNRGFTVISSQNGELIKRIKNIDLDEKINIKFYDGLAVAQIKSKDYYKWYKIVHLNLKEKLFYNQCKDFYKKVLKEYDY